MSREAYWRNQRSTKKPPAQRTWGCPHCGHAAYDNPPSVLHRHNLGSLDMTTGEIDAFLGQAEVPRDRFGRPLIQQPSGKPKAYTRCTTYVGCLEDTFNLSQWQQRMVALGLAQRPDLMLAVGSLTANDKQPLNDVCKQAMEAASASAGATIGTALHKMCERLDRREKFTVPAQAKADIDAYRDATKHITWTAIETLLVNDELEVAGTPDREGHAPGISTRVWDLKTGSIEYGLGKIAMQMAVYAHSQQYDMTTGARQTRSIDLNTATIIHLPAGEGRCELVDVDIAAGWEAVQLAREVRAWRKRKDLRRPHGATLPLTELIATAPSEQALKQLWSVHAHEWTAEHTEAAKARKAQISAA